MFVDIIKFVCIIYIRTFYEQILMYLIINLIVICVLMTFKTPSRCWKIDRNMADL